jgi:LPXTG-motif cell wall-anchored protein
VVRAHLREGGFNVKRVLRLTIGLMAAALVTLGFAGVASAQTADCPYGGCPTNLVLSSSVVAPGGTVTVSGEGFLPDHDVTISLGAEVLGETMTNGEGAFSAQVTVPTQPGTYTITATDGVNVLSAQVTVAAGASNAGSVSPSGTLPYTGSDSSLPLAQIGAGLVAAGAVIVLSIRKHQHTAAKVRIDS